MKIKKPTGLAEFVRNYHLTNRVTFDDHVQFMEGSSREMCKFAETAEMPPSVAKLAVCLLCVGNLSIQPTGFLSDQPSFKIPSVANFNVWMDVMYVENRKL